MSFLKLDDLADRLVGKAARGARPVIRWPREVIDFTLLRNFAVAGRAMRVIARLFFLVSILFFASKLFFASHLPIGVGVASLLASLLLGFMSFIAAADEQSRRTGEIMKPLLGKDPYLDLRLAAYLTVGVMPEWLRKQMDPEKTLEWEESGQKKTPLADGPHSRGHVRPTEPDAPALYDEDAHHMTHTWCGPEWQKARLAKEPYTVGRAGLDYLDLMSRIERLDKTPSPFYGKPMPPRDRWLPGSLKDAVGEIILFLSALPDSGEEPDEETMEAVMSTIDRLATIDGESFTEAVRRLREEDEDKKKAAEDKAKADYNGGIMRTVNATRDALAVENDDEYKEIQKGMARLGKISEAGERAAESVATTRAAAVSPTR